MKEYFKGRLEELRRLYRETGDGEYIYRTQEIQRALRHCAAQQNPQQVKPEHEASPTSH